MKVYVAESLDPDDFFRKRWEGRILEESLRQLQCRVTYRIVITQGLLEKALTRALKSNCDIFHLSCHGDSDGVQLTDKTELEWSELARAFRSAKYAPAVLVLSSCVAGDREAGLAFSGSPYRPDIIFGSEAAQSKITFQGACLAWPILYSELSRLGLKKAAFRAAITKMNKITHHKFVYWRWSKSDAKYRRFPAA